MTGSKRSNGRGTATVLYAMASRRQFVAAASAGLACTLLRPPQALAQAVAVRPVVLSVPGPGGALSTPLELAVRLGADGAEGIALRLKFVGGGGVALRDVQSGNAAFAVLGLPAVMDLHQTDTNIVALAPIEDLSLWVLVVRQELHGKVNRIEDLKGRTIGIFSSTLAVKVTSQQVTELVLRSHGVPVESVRLMAAGANWETQSAALLSQSVDACMVDAGAAQRLTANMTAFPLFSTGNPADVKRVPGVGHLRSTLFGRRDRIGADPALADSMVRVVKRALDWMAKHTPEQIADALGLKEGAERTALVEVFRKYPNQYSRDGKFSTAQLRETEVFFRASNPDNQQAQRISVETMIIDRWAGRKP